MENSECQKLAGRFERMASEGLVDVKFYVSGEAASEQVCREVNRLYAAVENGECSKLDFKDSYKQPGA